MVGHVSRHLSGRTRILLDEACVNRNDNFVHVRVLGGDKRNLDGIAHAVDKETDAVERVAVGEFVRKGYLQLVHFVVAVGVFGKYRLRRWYFGFRVEGVRGNIVLVVRVGISYLDSIACKERNF